MLGTGGSESVLTSLGLWYGLVVYYVVYDGISVEGNELKIFFTFVDGEGFVR